MKEDMSRNDSMGLRVVSNDNPYVPADLQQKTLQPRRLSSYFIILIESGTVTYNLDLQDIVLTEGQVLFAMPNQIFTLPARSADLQYYKVLFDDNTLALLPQQYSFLVNPLNAQSLLLDPDARIRTRKVFEIMDQILHSENRTTPTEIVLAYLNSILTEVSSAYFSKTDAIEPFQATLSKFMEFKLVVESHLTEQPPVSVIAEKLALTPNGLYRIVKEHSGISPKDFISNRIVLEAQRKLQYSNLSVKELAYELGFSDPDYFSRFFKKCTGQSISEFVKAQQDLSRQ